MEIQRNSKIALSVFALVMINVIAVDSLRNLPIGAQYGFSVVFFYLIGGLLFLIPVALIAAELATGWPKSGGIYIWVREAFGKQWGFLVIWLQWLYNIFWYPTIMSFIAGTLAFLIDPQLATNKYYIWGTVMVLFWVATFANWFGMHLSSWVSTIASIFGTLIPMIFIIILGAIWLGQGHPIQIALDWKSFFPDFSHMENFALLTIVLFGLVGLEMSAVHAGDVKNPQRDYPRALWISCILILGTLTLGSLAIALVIPQAQIQLASGLMDSYRIFFSVYHFEWMTPVIALLIILGTLGAVAAWIIGPSKGVMIAAEDGSAPAFFAKQNRHGVPTSVLWVQGGIFTILSTAFIFMPTINSAFVLLSAITAQLAILMYLVIFAAAVRLRYTQPNVPRKYTVPGGKFGMWLTAGAGYLICLVVLVLGFLPPSQIPVGNVTVYETLLIGGMLLVCLPPFFMNRKLEIK
jgi:putative glutamate/gamma-aminobutyrate antiporter